MTDREKIILEMIQELFLMLKTGYEYPENFESDNPIKIAYKKSFDLTVFLRSHLNKTTTKFLTKKRQWKEKKKEQETEMAYEKQHIYNI